MTWRRIATVAFLLMAWTVPALAQECMNGESIPPAEADNTIPPAAWTTALHDAVLAVAKPEGAATVPALVFRPVNRSSGSFVLRSLYVTSVTMQALDVHSTLRAFSRGAVEGNPLMMGITSSKPLFIAAKAGIATGIVMAAHGMARNHRVAAIATMVALNSAYAYVVAHNYHLQPAGR